MDRLSEITPKLLDSWGGMSERPPAKLDQIPSDAGFLLDMIQGGHARVFSERLF